MESHGRSYAQVVAGELASAGQSKSWHKRHQATWFCGTRNGCGYKHNEQDDRRCKACGIDWQQLVGFSRQPSPPWRTEPGWQGGKGSNKGKLRAKPGQLGGRAPEQASPTSPDEDQQSNAAGDHNMEVDGKPPALATQEEVDKFKKAYDMLLTLFGAEDEATAMAKDRLDFAVARRKAARPPHLVFWELNKKVRVAEKKLAAAKISEAAAEDKLAVATEELEARKAKTQLCLDHLADFKMDQARLVLVAAQDGIALAARLDGYDLPEAQEGASQPVGQQNLWAALGLSADPIQDPDAETQGMVQKLQEALNALRQKLGPPNGGLPLDFNQQAYERHQAALAQEAAMAEAEAWADELQEGLHAAQGGTATPQATILELAGFGPATRAGNVSPAPSASANTGPYCKMETSQAKTGGPGS